MNSAIIFVQAPADVKYALEFYEKNYKTLKISICCINVQGMYNFIKSKNLIVENLYFIPYNFNLSYSNPITLIKVKVLLYKTYSKLFRGIRDNHIYFFSHFFDYLSFFMLARLSKGNNITLINHYDDAIMLNYKRPKKSIRILFICLLYKWLTNIKFDFFEFSNSIILEFPYKKYGIYQIQKKQIDYTIIDKYKYRINTSCNNNILFLENDFEKENLHKNYQEVTSKLVQYYLDNDYNIYIKPHPRLGYSFFLNNYPVKFINADIPAEFINEKDFCIIMGISSTSLTFFAERKVSKVLSLIELYLYQDFKVKEREIKYLEDLSKNIYYPKNINDIL